MPSGTEQVAGPLYDHIAAVYDQTRQLPSWVPDRLATEALRLCSVQAPRVLEIGVGTGRIAGGFLRSGLVSEYVGLDISPAMLAELKTKFGDRVTIVHGDASRLPFDDDSFDAVLSCHVLQMVDDLPAALGEVRRVLRPAGLYLHCTDELAPHHQQIDQVWQRLLVDGQPSYRPTTRYDMRRSEVVALWSDSAADVHAVEVATWTTRQRLGDLLAAYQNKAYPSCHRVSDLVFTRAIDQLREYCHAAYGRLDGELESTSRMELVAVRMPPRVLAR